MQTFVPSSIMNGTKVATRETDALLNALASDLDLGTLAPEIRKAATYLLENSSEIGVSSIRELARAAGIKPNTLVRLARRLGFDGYDDFREPFREEIRRGSPSFPDRTRWLQSLQQSGRLGSLYALCVDAALCNIEETVSGISEAQLTAAARAIWASRRTFVLGVGVHHPNARNFAYLAGTGMNEVHAIPRSGSTPVDDLARAGPGDVLIAMTCKPYRREVVDAMAMAREQGLVTIGISDSPASPVITGADHRFVVSVEAPQFFPSSVSVIALLETLLSFVIAIASPDIVSRVEAFHARRHALGLYVDDPTG